jgi:hypothetical protein
MFESQLGGVQCQTRGAAAVWHWLTKLRLVVDLVAAEWKTKFRQMDADLMRATGL